MWKKEYTWLLVGIGVGVVAAPLIRSKVPLANKLPTA
jgi:hypothetical protein